MRRSNNFKETIGTPKNDRLKVKKNRVGFGRAGNDRMIVEADPLSGINNGATLVGGNGDDTYVASLGTTAILDAGSTKDRNTVVAKRIVSDSSTAFIMDLDDRHLVFGDARSLQFVILVDWKESRNRINTLELADGRFSMGSISSQYKTFPGYAGSYSLEEILKATISDVDLIERVLSRIDRDIDAVVKRAGQL